MMEKYLEELTNWAALFEVPVSEFRGLKNCRRETIMIKQLWDYAYVIRSSVDNWKTTHWKEIDVERMEIECKHFAKSIFCLFLAILPTGATILVIKSLVIKHLVVIMTLVITTIVIILKAPGKAWRNAG